MEFNALQSTRSVFGPSLLRHSSRAGFTLFYRFTSTNSAASRICYAEYLLHCACTLFLVWQSGLLWCRYASLQFLPHVRALRNNSAEFSTVQKGSLTQKQLHSIWLILIRSVSMLAQISALKLEPVGVARRRSRTVRELFRDALAYIGFTGLEVISHLKPCTSVLVQFL